MLRHVRSFISQIYLLQSVLVPGCGQCILNNCQQAILKIFYGLGSFAEILLSFWSLGLGVVYHSNYWLLCKSVKLFKSLPCFLFLKATYKEAKSWLKAHVYVLPRSQTRTLPFSNTHLSRKLIGREPEPPKCDISTTGLALISETGPCKSVSTVSNSVLISLEDKPVLIRLTLKIK